MDEKFSLKKQTPTFRIPIWRQLVNMIGYSIVLVLLPSLSSWLSRWRKPQWRWIGCVTSFNTLKQQALAEWLKNGNLTIDTLLAGRPHGCNSRFRAGP